MALDHMRPVEGLQLANEDCLVVLTGAAESSVGKAPKESKDKSVFKKLPSWFLFFFSFNKSEKPSFF